jgi:hypothetical protein
MLEATLPLPEKCQMAKVNGYLCDKSSYGFVVGPKDTPRAIYADRRVLCRRHAEALASTFMGGKVLTVDEIEAMVEPQENGMQAVMDTTTDTKETSMQEVETIIIEAPGTGDIPMQTPASNGTSNGHVQAPAPAGKTALVDVYCAKAQELLEQAKQLRAAIVAAPMVAKELTKAAEKKEAEAAKAQLEANKIASKPKPRALDGLPLVRLALVQCGVMDIDAVEMAIDAGILAVVRQPKAKTTPAVAVTSEATAAPKQAGGQGITPERQAMVNEAHRLHREGKSQKDIAELMGLQNHQAAYHLIRKCTPTA